MSELRKDSVLAKHVAKEHYIVAIVIGCFLLWSALSLRHAALIDWDEGIFALQGQWLSTTGSQGKPFNFQTPPLFQLIAAFMFSLVRAQPFVLPLISVIFSCLSIILVFLLGKLLYSSRDGLYAVLLFISTEFFLFFSHSGLSESTFLFFFIATVFFFFKGLKYNSTRYFLFAGLFTTAAFYTKYSAFPLLAVFFIIGILKRKTINRKWLILTVILPILLYVPYIVLFLNVVGWSGISARHGSLLGIHHHQFLYYLIRFAPFPLLFTFLKTANRQERCTWDFYILVPVLVFFVFLGFYHHYFRLAYPIIPFLAILAAQYIKRQKTYVIVVILIISLGLSIDTITYRTDTPHEIGVAVTRYARDRNIQYVYTSVPPNINFYIGGEIAIPETHPWHALGKKFPAFVRGRKVLYQHNNELQHENNILVVYATAYDTLDPITTELLRHSRTILNMEFLDAPVYYKDIFNPQRSRTQLYRVYMLERKMMGGTMDQCWQLGFNQRFTVMLMKKNGGKQSPP